jgi:TFIIF-interacting CTD phosphatase-like protein
LVRSKSASPSIDISYLLQERESCLQYFISPPTKKVVIFDLDETLIYNSSRTHPLQAPIIFPRPYYYDMFVKISEFYEIWVWSASERHYIDSVLKNMDPYKAFVKRVLTRNDCTLSREGYLIKDFGRFLNLDISQVIIVDNTAASFILNVDNGILVSSFNGNYNDIELLNVTGLLLSARNDKDVRLALRVYRV